MLQIMRTFVTLQNVANEAHCIRNIDKILIIFPGKGKALVCSKHKSSKSCFVGDNLS